MSEFAVSVGSLEEQALKRRERLKNLKRKAETKSKEETPQTNNGSESTAKVNLPVPTNLLKASTDEQQNSEVEMEEIKPQNEDVVTKITEEMNELKVPLVIEEIDIQNLAPRKPDWDLKRDVSKKLDILERRTQRAIAEIIRDRLKNNQSELDLQAVNTVGYTAKASQAK